MEVPERTLPAQAVNAPYFTGAERPPAIAPLVITVSLPVPTPPAPP
jgi:hypothetical protein